MSWGGEKVGKVGGGAVVDTQVGLPLLRGKGKGEGKKLQERETGKRGLILGCKVHK